MNNNKITINHIGKRIGYGLKFELQCDSHEDYSEMEIDEFDSFFKKGAVWDLCTLTTKDIPFYGVELDFLAFTKKYAIISDNGCFKPILRNISSLTNEKLREEMAKLGHDSCIDFTTIEREGLVKRFGLNYWINNLPYVIVNYLIENNYWLGEPEGTFVYAESLEINPYN